MPNGIACIFKASHGKSEAPQKFCCQLYIVLQDIKKAHKIEGWGFLPLYLYKLGRGLLGGSENPMRTLYRLLLLVTFPGLNDHFPGDYEAKLRKALKEGNIDQRQA